MNKIFLFSCVIFLFSCQNNESNILVKEGESNENNLGAIELDYLDYSSREDSLTYQAMFKWNEKQWLGIAEPVVPNKKGLSLQLLEMKEDSTMRLVANSSYGYDSRTFYPSYFKANGRHLLLVNMGERESWGNKIIEVEGQEFKDLGFIDVAKATRNPEGEENEYRFENIAKHTNIIENESITIQFDCDSVVLFDDLKGAIDTIISSNQVEYLLKGDQFQLETKY